MLTKPRHLYVLTVFQAPSLQGQQVPSVYHVELANTVLEEHCVCTVSQAKHRMSLEAQVHLCAWLVQQGSMRPMEGAVSAHYARQERTVSHPWRHNVVFVHQASMQRHRLPLHACHVSLASTMLGKVQPTVCIALSTSMLLLLVLNATAVQLGSSLAHQQMPVPTALQCSGMAISQELDV